MTIPFHAESGRRPDQRGAILVTSLLLLLVITIIGVTVMQMSRMQERMAGNARDVNLAFQAGESSLRAGEAVVLAFAAAPVTCAAAPCDVFERKTLPPLNYQTKTWWTDTALSDANVAQSDGLSENPRYVVEQYGWIRNSWDVTDTTGRDVYQISSRSTGGSGKAEVILQSTYARTSQ
jgi:type IV pilus assembly protein PilX